MCQAMSNDDLGNEEELKEKRFIKQLAATVIKIQWSYAIFWTCSTRQHDVLAWTYGYYNGDIKTRKTTQPTEFKDDHIGLERSEQLRELYESLSAGEENKRPSASLSPEDLTDAEWYYLVCMSFTFRPGQCLPGKAFASNQHIWLSNAQYADSKFFSRALLAKSASIQTIVCFPFLGGVLELGSTELVSENSSLIQQTTTSFWDVPDSICSDNSKSTPSQAEKDGEVICPNFEEDIEGDMVMGNHNLMTDFSAPAENVNSVFPFTLEGYAPESHIEVEHIADKVDDICSIRQELNLASPAVSSNDCCADQYNDGSYFIEGLNGAAQAHSRQLIDDDLSNGVYGSFASSDYPSMPFANAQGLLASPTGQRPKNDVVDVLQDANNSKLIAVDLDGHGTNYAETISSILSSSKQVQAMPSFSVTSPKTSFTVWTRSSLVRKPVVKLPQQLLKKILMNPTLKQGGQHLKPQDGNPRQEKTTKLEGDDVYANHVLSERRRREKLNEKFVALRSLIPSLSKVDKASILSDTIEYLKQLERRIEELETCQQAAENGRGRRENLDVTERTSDNYGEKGAENVRRSCRNKRKSDDIAEHHWVLTKDGPSDVNVTIIEKEVLIEMNCPWRDCLLLDITESINSLHMDPLSIQTSTVDDTLSLTIKSKFRNSVAVSPGMIKRTLKRVISKC